MLIPTSNTISTVTDLRINTIKVLKDVQKNGMKYVFSRSKPEAVLLSMDEYRRMIEKIEDQTDSQFAIELSKLPKTNSISLENVAKEYGVDL